MDIIIGLNGLIWVSQGSEQEDANGQSGQAGGLTGVNQTAGVDGLDATGVYSNVNDVRIILPKVYACQCKGMAHGYRKSRPHHELLSAR